MLGDISGLDNIYIICGRTDMRKSIDGLCSIVQDQLKMNPDASALFLFCGRRRDRIKALFHEPDGYVLIYKRLSVEGGYQWPRNKDEVRNLTWREFDWLMSGIDIDQPKAIQSE
jgi:transposase